MEVLPAIDLLGGKCVRLVQGRYDRVIRYEDDPVKVARQFAEAGARRMHVIDLDGARAGRIANLAVVKRIIEATGAGVQFGGGVRDAAAIEAALAAGASCIIVGTRALEDWEWFSRVAHEPAYGQHLALGLDARLGKLAVHGWQQETERNAVELAEAVADWPLAAIVYTDIARDGMLLGPNVEAIRTLASVSTVPIVASGGVTDLQDVARLAEFGLSGVVIGRALYEGTLRLGDAIRLAAESR